MIGILSTVQFWADFALQTGKHFLWYGTMIALFALAEHLWPAGPQPTLRDRANNCLIAFALSVLGAVLNVSMTGLSNMLVAQGLIGVMVGDWTPSSFGEILLAPWVFVLCWDFFQYWVHRAQHEFSWLWFAHALHHDEAHINTTTALRNSIWNLALGYFVIGLPVTFLCGVNLMTIYASMFFFSTYGFFNHANIRLNLGVLGKIVSGPHWHRLHHSRDFRHHNCNYAAFFPFIDIAFGTYRHPAPDDYPATGVVGRSPRPPGLRNLALDLLGL